MRLLGDLEEDLQEEHKIRLRNQTENEKENTEYEEGIAM
jgi:hypothetical protein